LINVIDGLNPLDVADADGVVRPHYIVEDFAVVRSASDNRRLELIVRAASLALGFAVAATAEMYAVVRPTTGGPEEQSASLSERVAQGLRHGRNHEAITRGVF
jgi:hypothetical protein